MAQRKKVVLLKKRGFSLFLLAVLTLLNFWLWKFILTQDSFLRVTFFDVGQGEAIFIEIPPGYQILIDGGPDLKVLEKLSKKMPFWDRNLDLVVLTHPEKDHLFGLLEVLKRYKVEKILWTGVIRKTAEFLEWKKRVEREREEGAEFFLAHRGKRVILSKEIFIEILSPFEVLENKEFKNSNDTSIVGKLIFKEISFLFTGDISQLIEKELIVEESLCSQPCPLVNLDSDILKIAHHGSKNSNSQSFLERVSPILAIISVGKNNPYLHPHQEVLERLAKEKINIFRTDENGDLEIVSDGFHLKILK